MEKISVVLDDGTGQAFDEALKGTLPECGDLQVITKEKAMKSGRPAVMFAFTVRLPDGSLQRAQAVTPLRLFLQTVRILTVRHGNVLEG